MLTATFLLGELICTAGTPGSGDSCSLNHPILGRNSVRNFWREGRELFAVPQVWVAPVRDGLCLEHNLKSVSQLNNFTVY